MTQILDDAKTDAQSDAGVTATAISTTKTDLSNLSPTELIARINELETRLKVTTENLNALRSSNGNSNINNKTNVSRRVSSPLSSTNPPTQKKEKVSKEFDPSLYHTRHIALKFAYVGGHYGGYEHSNNSQCAPAKPTVEEVLWKALRKTRLISADLSEGADRSYDVVWDERDREALYGSARRKGAKERLELVWDEEVKYSKCGRTDRGVSAFGQVVGITVRSNRPKGDRKKRKKKKKEEDKVETGNEITSVEGGAQPEGDHVNGGNAVVARESLQAGQTTGEPDAHLDAEIQPEVEREPEWDPIRDEMPYIQLLNAILPPSIRILAWCPDPPADFDARFSCESRTYRYFFTNPAICPSPGPLGFKTAGSSGNGLRDGWLDIDAMKKAAKKLEGVHDYRNFCKIDASKQMPSCERRIHFTDIEEFGDGMQAFLENPNLNKDGGDMSALISGIVNTTLGDVNGPKVYTFVVNGTAFLWHQVRCMVAVLFLVGQGLEKPEIVDQLLDIQNNPRRPAYEMADDAPLVLWDCVFPDGKDESEKGLRWIYAGDESTWSARKSYLGLRATKSDGKFGNGGVTDDLWRTWREAKIQETLAAGLLGLTLKQGDGSAILGGAQTGNEALKPQSQRVFDGSSTARYIGEYVPVMEKIKMGSLEEQNERYKTGRGMRIATRKALAAEVEQE